MLSRSSGTKTLVLKPLDPSDTADMLSAQNLVQDFARESGCSPDHVAGALRTWAYGRSGYGDQGPDYYLLLDPKRSEFSPCGIMALAEFRAALEIKHLYLVPEVRGQGLGHAVCCQICDGEALSARRPVFVLHKGQFFWKSLAKKTEPARIFCLRGLAKEHVLPTSLSSARDRECKDEFLFQCELEDQSHHLDLGLLDSAMDLEASLEAGTFAMKAVNMKIEGFSGMHRRVDVVSFVCCEERIPFVSPPLLDRLQGKLGNRSHDFQTMQCDLSWLWYNSVEHS